jgi:hypothetical protein
VNRALELLELEFRRIGDGPVPRVFDKLLRGLNHDRWLLVMG